MFWGTWVRAESRTSTSTWTRSNCRCLLSMQNPWGASLSPYVQPVVSVHTALCLCLSHSPQLVLRFPGECWGTWVPCSIVGLLHAETWIVKLVKWEFPDASSPMPPPHPTHFVLQWFQDFQNYWLSFMFMFHWKIKKKLLFCHSNTNGDPVVLPGSDMFTALSMVHNSCSLCEETASLKWLFFLYEMGVCVFRTFATIHRSPSVPGTVNNNGKGGYARPTINRQTSETSKPRSKSIGYFANGRYYDPNPMPQTEIYAPASSYSDRSTAPLSTFVPDRPRSRSLSSSEGSSEG